MRKILLLTTFFIAIFMFFSCEKNPTGSQILFNPSITYGSMMDQDGNTYKTVTIGTQVWMAGNLKVTHYRNGNPIPNVTPGTQWSNLETDAYCNYDNDANNATTYGRLYNWYAVNDPSGLVPEGWHVPTGADWQTLVDYLGGSSVAGGKLKETGTTHWRSPNTGATNESGFSALPGGYRNDNGSFYDIGARAGFWSSSESGPIYAKSLYLFYYDSEVYSFWGRTKRSGFSVRCVRD